MSKVTVTQRYSAVFGIADIAVQWWQVRVPVLASRDTAIRNELIVLN